VSAIGDSGPQLAPPDARQGPGPMPHAVIAALDPAITRLVTRTLPGGSRGAGVGLGTELAQLRPYEVGDDVRHIDASASARTGTMHVRLHVPERALTTWIVLDLSPSMAFGTADRLKADVAEGAARVFGRLGVRRAGSVGIVSFGAGPVKVLPPRGSRPGMVALGRQLEAGVAPDGLEDPAALANALRRALAVSTQPGLVVVISDFRGQQDWQRPLGALRMRHSLLAIEVSDPRESELPNVGRLAVVDPETGVLVRVDTSSRRLRQRFATIERERREAVDSELRHLAIRHVRLSTDEDWLRELGRRLG
jgi:uncharacterized protein (DUF58 family)